MASRKTWIWIIVGVFGTCVLLLLAVAGAGIYFVTSHISSKQTTSGDAFQTFDTARAKFKDQKPLLEIDDHDKPRLPKALSTFPTSPKRPEGCACSRGIPRTSGWCRYHCRSGC